MRSPVAALVCLMRHAHSRIRLIRTVRLLEMTIAIMDHDDEEHGELTCQAVYLLQGAGTCYLCKKPTRMFALMVLPPFSVEGEQVEAMDEDGSMLNMPTALPPALVQAIRPVTGSQFRPDQSRMAELSYWMNHCEHCDAKQGDHFVHGPDGPFWPNDETEMPTIVATKFDGPFRLPDASTSYSGAMADWRDWKHGVVRPPPPVRKPRKSRKKADKAG